MIDLINDNKLIFEIVSQNRRSPLQFNELNESDAEIIQLDESSPMFLAATTCSIASEIESGLYDDMYIAGWMSVIASMSNLAAVGAKPVGILISKVLPRSITEDSLSNLHQGMGNAAEACGTFIIGGDTKGGSQLMLTGTALGTLYRRIPLSRKGCKPGDLVYSTNFMGNGNAFALYQLNKQSGSGVTNLLYRSFQFMPVARLKEGQSLCHISNACMDTSEGVLNSLDRLMRVNGYGFELNANWESYIDQNSKMISGASDIPLWLLLAGQYGEFELIFTVPKNKQYELYETAREFNWDPLPIGKVIEESVVRMPLYGHPVDLDTAYLRNLAHECGSDTRQYFEKLLEYDSSLRVC